MLKRSTATSAFLALPGLLTKYAFTRSKDSLCTPTWTTNTATHDHFPAGCMGALPDWRCDLQCNGGDLPSLYTPSGLQTIAPRVTWRTVLFLSCSAITFLLDSGCHALPSLPTNQTISFFSKQCMRKATESGSANSLTNSTLFDYPWYNKLMSNYMGMCSLSPHWELSEDKMDIAFSKRSI